MPPFAWFIVYNALQAVGLPVLAAWLLIRKVRSGKGEGWTERFGAAPISRGPRPIWVHAVSAGEASAAASIVRELRERWPDVPVVVSTLTPGGRDMALKLCDGVAGIFYFPWDIYYCVRRSMKRVRPRAVILMEAEVWPNYLSVCRRLRVPVAIVNGRVSDRGMSRATRIRGAMRWMYGLVASFGMQSEEDARRVIALGAPADRVQVLGQTKFDSETTPLESTKADELRKACDIPRDAPVLVAGNTRPGEEAVLLDAFDRLREQWPELRMLIAPRHLDRVDEVVELISTRGLRLSLRTAPGSNPDVLLLDTMGELALFYAIGDVAFVGGTLANIGGHNLLQPVAQGRAVLFGPHTQNVRDLADLLIRAGVGFLVRDAAEITAIAGGILADPARRAELSRSALDLISANRGATKRYMGVFARLMGDGQ